MAVFKILLFGVVTLLVLVVIVAVIARAKRPADRSIRGNVTPLNSDPRSTRDADA